MSVSCLLEIQNIRGLHARAASAFVKEADRFKADIWVEKDGQRVSGRSIMGLMMLAAAKGTFINVLCEGIDEQEAKKAIEALVNAKFHEEN